MKNQPIRPLRPAGQAQPRPLTTPPPDPLEQQARHRRLYTDFLALALYPGMRAIEPARERPSAA